jgi:hypothetical protein
VADRYRRISLEFVEINVEIGAANSSRVDLEDNLSSPSPRLRDVLYFDVP